MLKYESSRIQSSEHSQSRVFVVLLFTLQLSQFLKLSLYLAWKKCSFCSLRMIHKHFSALALRKGRTLSISICGNLRHLPTYSQSTVAKRKEKCTNRNLVKWVRKKRLFIAVRNHEPTNSSLHAGQENASKFPIKWEYHHIKRSIYYRFPVQMLSWGKKGAEKLLSGTACSLPTCNVSIMFL